MIELTADELRLIQERRAQQALQPQQMAPSPNHRQITEGEFSLIQLHRLAQQSRIVGSGIVSNLPDPLQQLHAVAIVVLRDLRASIDAVAAEHGQITCSDVFGLIDGKLAILGDHGTPEAEPSSPGSG